MACLFQYGGEMMNLSQKKVLVLGLARSGIASVGVLHRHGATVLVNDAGTAEKLTKDVQAVQGMVQDVVLGGHPLSLLNQQFDLIVKNPGIPYDIPFLVEARNRGIPVVSEVELAYQVTRAPFIGITGSNGKTTTTSWVGEILKNTFAQVHVAGNIGLPLSQEVDGLDEDHRVVVELSSFQLNDVMDFRPQVAALLNIYPSHLDWHHTLENYIGAKANLFRNQGSEDWAILNGDQEQTLALIPCLKSKVFTFSTTRQVEQGAWIKDNVIWTTLSGEANPLISLSELGIGYAHNHQNALAATLISYAAGASFEAINKGLKEFRGVKHRFQVVDTINGVLFINDSKATNSQASLTALSLPQSPIVWIAGGLDRGQDIEEITTLAAKRCKTAILLGQTKDRFAVALREKGVSELYLVQNMAEAVEIAKKISLPGDTVLLSPACASWDMYPSFEHRGDDFINEVTRK